MSDKVFARYEGETNVDLGLLAAPIRFGTSGRTAPNRIFKSALTELLATFDAADPQKSGIPTERLINLYEKFGNGGFGIVTTGNVALCPKHMEAAGNILVCREAHSAERQSALQKLAAAAKADGALAIAQLSHAGRQTPLNLNATPFGASAVPLEVPIKAGFGRPVPLSEQQIQTEVVDRFLFAAVQLQAAGFDGVELHGAHGYLLSNFLSPTTNLRTDRYGGNVENRCRIIAEIYSAIRKAVPKDFVIGIKINSVEYQSGGVQIEDVVRTAEILDNLGFDYVSLSGGSYEKIAFQHQKESTRKREAFFAEFAETVKPHLKKAKTVLTGGFRTAAAMVKAIRENTTDAVGIGRPITAEPDLPKKILSGKVAGAALNHLDGDFVLSMVQSNAQMGCAGNTTLAQCGGDVCFGIPDFSNPAEMEIFQKKVAEWFGRMMECEVKLGRAYHGILEYGEPITSAE